MGKDAMKLVGGVFSVGLLAACSGEMIAERGNGTVTDSAPKVDPLENTWGVTFRHAFSLTDTLDKLI